MNLQNVIAEYRAKWMQNGKWVEPNLQDAIEFMVTEAVETMEARLRLGNYVRNNPSYVDAEQVAIEAFDTIMMACVVLDILGYDLEEVALKKLEYMDNKRS